ncbi:hypothetical protein E2562_022437, partial [Oryza meyeriana var. granulata]
LGPLLILQPRSTHGKRKLEDKGKEEGKELYKAAEVVDGLPPSRTTSSLP